MSEPLNQPFKTQIFVVGVKGEDLEKGTFQTEV